MKLLIKLTTIIFIIFSYTTTFASSNITLEKIDVNLNDKSSLQRGAKVFFDKCIGCHSLKYIRYIDLAKGIGFNEKNGKSIDDLIKENLISDKNININDPVIGYMYKNDAIKWFGKNPPDLSLVSRYRTDNWIYTYMKSFYEDEKQTFGVNNLIFPDVGMPHVLLNLQGKQIIKKNKDETNLKDILEIIEKGDLSKNEYDKLIKDLVCFLSYVAEPSKLEREKLGYFVLAFLFVITFLLYMLKREYWKDIKK